MHNYIKSTLSMSPVMPVLTINNIDNVEYLFEALINGNLKVVEITLILLLFFGLKIYMQH